jgi:hypothetical protein
MTSGLRLGFDVRERALFAAFQARLAARGGAGAAAFAARLEPLPMSDVYIEPADPAAPGPVIAVERKGVTDLMASYFDGRLAEQCARMGEWQRAAPDGARWVVVVVEGAPSAATFAADGASGRQTPEQRYRHAVKVALQLALDKHRPEAGRLVVRTASLDETAALLMTLRKTIAAWTAGGGAAGGAGLGATALPKRTHAAPLVRHLGCTLGVSAARAQRAAAVWPHAAALVDAMRADPPGTAARLAALVGGPKLAARIWADLGTGDHLPAAATKRPRLRARRGDGAGTPSSRRVRARAAAAHRARPADAPPSPDGGPASDPGAPTAAVDVGRAPQYRRSRGAPCKAARCLVFENEAAVV